MKQGEDWRTTLANTYEIVKTTTQMRPSRFRAILIFLVNPITTLLFEGDPYVMEYRKPQKSRTKIFQPDTLSPHGINERLSFH